MNLDPHIHPSAFIGDGVTLGADVSIGPAAVLLGPLTVGDRVWIGPGAVVGTPPEISSLHQDRGWAGEAGHRGVTIGDDVVIRESVTIQQGSHRTTSIGDRTWLLSASYVAHDGLVGADVTLSAGARLGGHVVVGGFANIGMNATVHQRRIVGAGAMVGMATPVARDVPPFAKVFGSPARMHGLNEYVLRKIGASDETIAAIAAAYGSGRIDLREATQDAAVEEFARWWATQDAGPTVPAELEQ